ncbi:DEAD DEAH box RNA helicase, putative [Babesia ovis]|uniref:DEAD DEAH box RNA helicase, putative n=1 Tax=Babesia ovis TaxID=5869 RepID=A0A9W5TBJ1_BABOV|nr:DEAD DEAH box RNA helicase, putative [Babesia ovis]
MTIFCAIRIAGLPDSGMVISSPKYLVAPWNSVMFVLDPLLFPKDVEFLSYHVANIKEKPEDLAQAVAKLLSDGSRICVYAGIHHIKQCLQATGSLQRYPLRKPEQALMLRRFRKGQFAILMTDTDTGKLPSPDIVLHYDLPKTTALLHQRQRQQRCNVFFYLTHERVLLAHLQCHLGALMKKWELPSRTEQASAFLDNISNMVDTMNPLPVTIQFGTSDYQLLGALLYMAYRKFAHRKKHYLLHDPGFQRFKTRRDVETFLADCGITSYGGITLTKKGFVIDSYDMLCHPMIHDTAELASIQQLRRRVQKGFIKSHQQRQSVFNKLARQEERRMVHLFRSTNKN